MFDSIVQVVGDQFFGTVFSISVFEIYTLFNYLA